jgi:hypothetical protein
MAAWRLRLGIVMQNDIKATSDNIEAFHLTADAVRGPGALDDALAALNCALLEEMLEIYIVTLVHVGQRDRRKPLARRFVVRS